jgi:hypothetical protein
MQPSSDRPDSSTPALRRWGPLVAIVAVVAVVAAVVLVSGGDDGDSAEGGTDDTAETDGAGDGEATGGDDSGTGPPDDGAVPDGAISFSTAEEEGLDVEFPDTCDEETGNVAMPYYFTHECYADAEAVTTPGTRGVTDDSVKVVIYLRAPDDPIYQFITAPLAVDDTAAQTRETFQGYVDLYNEFEQTYGRTVEIEFLVGSGNIADEVSARADAVKAMEEMEAFAVLNGPDLSNAWTQEIQARGGVCISCPAIGDPAPNVFGIAPSAAQNRAAFIDYASKVLVDSTAEHAGDESMHDTDRVFGHLYIDTGSEESRSNAQKMKSGLEDVGIEVAEQVGYALDPATIQEQAGSAIAKFKAAGVTSIVYQADPIGPASFTQEATRQDYFPEWILAPSLLADTAAFSRTYDQEQWANAFGISALGTRTAPVVSSAYRLWDWAYGGLPPADDTAQLLWPPVSLFFAGLQAAGPDLTAESFRDGLFSLRTLDQAVTQPTISYGDRGIWDDFADQDVDVPDYYGIDDWVQIWWDPDVEGPDEIFKEGTGLWRFVDGGQRHYPGDFPDELDVFDPEGTVTIVEEIPESEEPKDYPSPDLGTGGSGD